MEVTFGEAHETNECPGCNRWIGGDEVECPLCGYDLFGNYGDEEDDVEADEPEVTLYTRTEPSGRFVKIIGEVKRGDEVLYTKTVITDDNPESVGDTRDLLSLEIEQWAVENTDYMPPE